MPGNSGTITSCEGYTMTMSGNWYKSGSPEDMLHKIINRGRSVWSRRSNKWHTIFGIKVVPCPEMPMNTILVNDVDFERIMALMKRFDEPREITHE